jgi:hypothetical protein
MIVPGYTDKNEELVDLVRIVESELATNEAYINHYQEVRKKLKTKLKVLQSIAYPKIHLTIEENETPNKSMIKGYSLLKKMDGTYHKVNVYVGKLTDFPKAKEDKKALEIARVKVNEYISKNLSELVRI